MLPRLRVLVAMLAVALASSTFPAAAAGAPGLRHVRVQLKWWHQFQFAGHYAAIAQGYYRDAGLEVELLEGAPGLDLAGEVAGGRAEFGVGEPTLLLDRAQGRPVVVLAAIFQHSPEVLVAREDARVAAPRDLIGRPVSLTQPGMPTVVAMLAREGIGLRQVDHRQPDRTFADLLERRVVARGAYMTDAPYLLQEAGVRFALLQPRAYGIDFYGDCLFTSELELRRHPRDVEAFRRATLRGWQYAMGHSDELVEQIARAYPGRLTRAQLAYEAAAMRPLLLADLVEVGLMTPGRWRHIADTFVQLGLLRADYSLAGFLYDPSPAPGDETPRLATAAAVPLLAAAAGALLLWLFDRKLHRTVQARTAELRAVNQQLRAAFDQTIDFIGLLRPDGTLIEVNRSALEFSGITLAEAVGRPFWNGPWWKHSLEARETCRRSVERARGGEFVRARTTHPDRDGAIHAIDFSIEPIRDASGNVVLLVPKGHDVTERESAEQALRRASQEWERTFDTVPDLICLLDRDQRILRANRSLADRLGRSTADLVGEPCTFLSQAPGSAPIPCPELLQNGCEVELQQLGGWYIVSASPLVDERGRVTGSVHVARDVTSLRQAAAQRARLQSQLDQAQKMEAIGRLAGGVAHDFNNMLAVILGRTELMKSRLPAGHALRPALLDIDRAAERSRDITRQLLAFSRRQMVEPCVIDVNAALANIRGVLVRLIGEDVELAIDAQPGLWPVRCDPGQLDQIVINLAANARDALPVGGALRVRTANVRLARPPQGLQTPFRAGEYVLLSMSDDGVGIDAAVLPRIFEPFLTTKTDGRGTGLGLATVYAVVEQNGGLIAVESAPGCGARFEIFLPRSAREAAAAVAAHQPARLPPGTTVLLVEDDEGVRAVAEGLLDDIGCTVLSASDAEQALAWSSRAQRIDLLLTDVVMPRMNGKELAERIGAVRPGLPVVYMSGYANEVVVQHGLAHGRHFLEKPFGLAPLAAKLHAALAAAAAQDTRPR